MRAEEPGRIADEVFERLFAQEALHVEPRAHPPDGVLRAYLGGRLRRSWPEPEEMTTNPGEWSRQAVSVHVLACPSCRERLRTLQSARRASLWSALSRRRGGFARWLKQTPRPALATMTVQSLVIVALAGLLFLRPAPLFPRSADLAVGSEPPATWVASPSAEGQALVPTAPGGEESLPPPAAQAIETLTRSPDPRTRLAALQELEQYPDPSLVEPLAEVYQRESHPEVREAVARTITKIVSHVETRYTRMWRALRHIRQSGGAPLDVYDQISQQLDSIMSDFYDMQEQQRYPQALYCSGPQELTLGQLGQIVLQLDGRLVFDRSSATKGFQVRVPYREGIEQALEHLQAQFHLVCGRGP